MLAIAAAALVGWYADVPILRQGAPGLVSMKANAAAGLMLLAFAVLLELASGLPAAAAAGAARLTVLLVAASTLVEELSGRDFGIDQLLVREVVPPHSLVAAGRMSWTTSVCLAALALSGLLWRRSRKAALVLTTLILCAAVSVVWGYVFHVPHFLDALAWTPMAVNTAAGLLLLSVAMMAGRTGPAWLEMLLDRRAYASRLARRSLATATAVVLTAGLLRVWGEEQGLFSNATGVACLSLLSLLTCIIVMMVFAGRLREHELVREAREVQLRLSEERFRLTASATADVVYDWSVVEDRIWWSDALHGLARADVETETSLAWWTHRLHPGDADRVTRQLEDFLQSDEERWASEYRFLRDDGEYAWVLERGHAVRDAAGAPVRMIGALSDVTSLREAEAVLRRDAEALEQLVATRTAELQEANRRLESEILVRSATERMLRQERDRVAAILRTAGAVIVVLDPNLNVLQFNAAAERITGWKADEVLGLNCVELFVPPDERERVGGMAGALSGQAGSFSTENHWLTRDGRKVLLAWSNTSLREDEGEGPPQILVSIGIDVTRQRAAEAALVSQNARLLSMSAELKSANAELEAFSYSVSHDLRAPLRAIDGFSRALVEDYEPLLDERAKDYLRRVRAATQRMGELIDHLLTLSRVSRCELRRSAVDLSAVAAETFERLREQDPAREVGIEIESGLRTEGDATLLALVLENLLGNAWKFTSKTAGARIRFSRGSSPGSFAVSDNGAGFDPALAGKLFSPFQRLHATSDYPGTGVGLATVRRILRRHGGDITARSFPGEGTTFEFTCEETGGTNA